MNTKLRISNIYRLMPILFCLSIYSIAYPQQDRTVFLGMGAKVGEITSSSVIVHVRLSRTPHQIGLRLIPGNEGWVRIKYKDSNDENEFTLADWQECLGNMDYSTQFNIKNLKPNTRYTYKVEMKDKIDGLVYDSEKYQFKTAPSAMEDKPVKFQITTCQDLWGLKTYLFMAAQNPDFLVSTGDNVYYDKGYDSFDDLVYDGKTVELAYQCYHRMYGSEEIVNYFRNIGGYFMKDDHDYRFNDADTVAIGRWIRKTETMAGVAKITNENEKSVFDEAWLTHEEGIKVFHDVFPMSEKSYRTFRWGKGVQIWLLEGRDYRSPNNLPDGPEKSIWGKEQKQWLKQTLLESDAKYRLVISPTPIVGPDGKKKKDNHANPNGFWTEGREFLDWIVKNELDNTILFCGDRHWQYHSTYKNVVNEFSCGPTATKHTAKVVKPYVDDVKMNYGNSIGGFLTISYEPGKPLTLSFHNERGIELYSYQIQN